MHYYEVAPTRVIRPDSTVFTYAYPSVIAVGQIVGISVGRQNVTGVVMRETTKPRYDTKEITAIIDPTPLPVELIRLCEWMSSYYATHFALVLQSVLPRGLEKTRRERLKPTKTRIRNRTNFVLNDDQASALKQIESVTPGTVLLHGITGSGKTAVYIEAAKKVLGSGKSIIVLVPEIALTSQIVDEFSDHFPNVVLTHSKQSEAERHITWKQALDTTEPHVVIGPRSALFLPLRDIGLIIIDEAHEPSYKQEQSPRYSALRAASVLARQHEATLILGSATPSISDYYLASGSDRPIIEMLHQAKTTKRPTVEIVDMTKRDGFKRHRFLSDTLIAKIEQSFATGRQALIFHNRRGSASTTLCVHCGWQATCPRCFIPLTLHADLHRLQCHVCGHTDKVATSCPVCKHTNIIHKGIGTKLIETELKKLFPSVTVGRFDGDTDSDQTVESQYGQIYDGSLQLLIGTQVIAKGLDLPHLGVVGIVQADAGLALPDYSSSERTFQLLAQAVGRVGRTDTETSVVVQSYKPDHLAVAAGLKQDYAAFYSQEITERKRANYPPFSFLLKLTCIYKTEDAAIRNAQALAKKLKQAFPEGIEVLGPTPAFYERQRDTYRWQLVLKSKRRALLVDSLRLLPTSHWQFELDPTSLI